MKTFVLKGDRQECPQELTSMRPIARRLRRLEDRFVPRDDPEARLLVELLHDCIRRRYEAMGTTCVYHHRLTIIEALLRRTP